MHTHIEQLIHTVCVACASQRYGHTIGDENTHMSHDVLVMEVIIILIKMPSLVVSKIFFMLKFLPRNLNAINMCNKRNLVVV